jgi:hypothetical protein
LEGVRLKSSLLVLRSLYRLKVRHAHFHSDSSIIIIFQCYVTVNVKCLTGLTAASGGSNKSTFQRATAPLKPVSETSVWTTDCGTRIRYKQHLMFGI